MRLRKSTAELVCTFSEFRSLNTAELCRRYDWGQEGEWLDRANNERAARELKEIEHGLAP